MHDALAGETVRLDQYPRPPGLSRKIIRNVGIFSSSSTTLRPRAWPGVVPYLTGAVDVPPEGSVLPDTYSYRRGESRAAVLARMQAAMRAELARLWARRSPTAQVVSPEAAIILASVVEKETGKASERRLIAGVFGNRLRRGM